MTISSTTFPWMPAARAADGYNGVASAILIGRAIPASRRTGGASATNVSIGDGISNV
jgi:hypothetical protein